MFQSYLRAAVRAFARHRVPAAINVVGLSIALACCIGVYLFLDVYYSLDTFHEHGERIVIAETVEGEGDLAQTWGTVPLPLGPSLAADLPAVERAARLAWDYADIRTAEHAFPERIALADPSFFDVFTFPMQTGSAALSNPDGAVLSDEAARRFFGEAKALGQTLTLAFEDGTSRTVTVAGVAAAFPDRASLRFDVMLPLAARRDGLDWSETGHAFLLLRHERDLATVAERAQAYLDRTRVAGNEAASAFAFERLTEPSPGGYHVISRPAEAPHPVLAVIMVSLGALMLALACFNYVNIALGSAARRLKEIGVRKVMGGSKRDLVAQFMTENLVLCGAALACAVALAWLVVVPLLNRTFVLDVSLSLTGDPGLWLFLGLLLAGVAVVSGAYPAFYVASFDAAEVFRGTRQLAEKRWLTRSLMTAQFAVACLAVIGTVLWAMNGRYLIDQPWGYEPDGTVVVRLSDPGQYDLLRDAALGHAHVRRVAGSRDHVGSEHEWLSYTFDGDDTEHRALGYAVGPGYTAALGLNLTQGRAFDERPSDAETVLVNQRLADEHGWTEAVGQTLRLDGEPRLVVGVVEDFVQIPIARVQPAVLTRASSPRHLVAETVPGQEAAVLDHLEAAWHALVPDQSFEAFAQREVFDARFDSYAGLSRAIGLLAALALLIACMGLFGLASQNAARQRKEVGVRKVLGASVPHIVFLVNHSLLGMLVVAAGIATVVSVAAVRFAMSFEVANLMPLSPLPFVLAYAVVLLTVSVSVGSQSRSLALVSPAEVLRTA